jgi:hypothetical protein
MANTVRYPKPEFTEDHAGSRLFLRKSVAAAPVLIACSFISVALFWTTPTIIAYLGFSGELSLVGGRVMMASAFVIFIYGIHYSNTKPAKAVSSCSRCNGKTRLEIHGGCQFYVCKVCETYIRGKDVS